MKMRGMSDRSEWNCNRHIELLLADGKLVYLPVEIYLLV